MTERKDMFNPFKALGDVNAMRKQAMVIQQALEKEEFVIEKGSVRIVITGNQQIKSVTVNGVENDDVRNAVNEAVKKSQQAAAMKLAELSKDFQQ